MIKNTYKSIYMYIVYTDFLPMTYFNFHRDIQTCILFIRRGERKTSEGENAFWRFLGNLPKKWIQGEFSPLYLLC